MKKKSKTPWAEHSVLVRSTNLDPFREIVAEGTLRATVDIVARTHGVARDNLMINFPDRQIAPFTFGPAEFDALMTETHMPADGGLASLS